MPGLASRRLALAAVLAAGSALFACQRPPAPPSSGPGTGFPLGRLVTPAALRCAPDRQWRRRRGSWSFEGAAAVGCWLGDPAPGAVRFELVPAAAEPFGLRLLWDGEVLLAPTLIEGPREVAVPDRLRMPGAHTLEVERFPLAADRAPPRVAFRRLAVGAGSAAPVAIGTGDAGRDAFLADFLLFGGASADRWQHDGVLVEGPGGFDVDLAARGEATLRLQVENASSATARFRAEAGAADRELSVPAGQRRRLRLELPAAARRLRLSVDGAPDGVFLFAAPRLVRSAPPRAEHRPRLILFVTLDTTRRDALGAYGAPPEATPSLDALARRATVFDHAVATAPWTLPSHASMFTGLYPSQHRAGVQARRLAGDADTLAARLREAGYLTAGIAGGVLMEHGFGVGRGFAIYDDPDGYRTSGEHLTRRALRLLDRAAGEPLFLFLNYFDAHMPYAPRPAIGRRLGEPAARDALPPGLWRDAAEGQAEAFDRLAHGDEAVTPETRAWLRAAYLSQVASMDAQIGRLFAELEARGLWDEALVVVTADHGEMLGENGLLAHAYRLTPELVDVPLLVKWPGQSEGRRDPRLVSLVDLYPTVLAAAGVEAPAGEGFDLAARPRRTLALFEEHVGPVHALTNRHLFLASHLWGLRQPRRRRVLWDDGERCAELVASGTWRPVPCDGTGRRLLAAIQHHLGAPDQEAAQMAGGLSPKDREALRALGYL